MFPMPILAMKWSTEEIFRIKIGCAFFVPFFAQAKKGSAEAKVGAQFLGKERKVKVTKTK
jgi:hypothetical protein